MQTCSYVVRQIIPDALVEALLLSTTTVENKRYLITDSKIPEGNWCTSLMNRILGVRNLESFVSTDTV